MQPSVDPDQEYKESSQDSTRKVTDFFQNRPSLYRKPEANHDQSEQYNPLDSQELPNRSDQLQDKNLNQPEEPERGIITAEQEGNDTQPNTDLLLDLKDSRDKLRGAEEEPKGIKTKRRLIILASILVSIIILALVATLVVKPTMKEDEPLQRQAYTPPSDLESKPANEKVALTIIKLAREGNSAEIITTWLGAKDLTTTKEDFIKLISSYQNSADGKSAELIEKKVGKTNLGVVGAEEVNAISLVYKSGYFEHKNNLYTKLNLYEPTATPGTWKLYLFEFKAEEADQPLVAELAT